MARLSPEKQAEAAAAADSTEAIPEDTYLVRLAKVDSTKTGPSGLPYWQWQLRIEEGPHKGRMLFTNTSLASNALWKLSETFTAFGASLDADTDDLLGEMCMAEVSQQVIEKGSRAGQMGNSVDRLFPGVNELDGDPDVDTF